MVNFMAICEAVQKAGGRYLLEHPADPGTPPFASIFCTVMLQNFLERTLGMINIIDQCMYGGATKKPTGLAHNFNKLAAGVLLCSQKGHKHGLSWGKDSSGTYHTRRLQSYPSELCRWFAWLMAATALEWQKFGKETSQKARAMRSTRWAWSSFKSQTGSISSMNEKFINKEPTWVETSIPAVYMHVDDGVVYSIKNSSPSANELMHTMANGLEDIGFEVKDRQESEIAKKAVGFELHKNPCRLKLPNEKAALLQLTMQWLWETDVVDTALLKSVLGIWIWAASLCRNQLAIPANIFQFIQRHFPRRASWWAVARKEWRWMMAMIPALEHRVHRKLWPVVFATDAEGANNADHGGFGVVGAAFNEETVLDTLKTSARPSFTVARLDGSIGHLHDPLKELKGRTPVSRVPREVLDPGVNWIPLASGRWKHKDHITLGEGRGTLVLLEKLAMEVDARGKIMVSLCDNFPWCGSSNKGRSPAPHLNYLLRKKTALEIATDLRIIHPWTDTKQMPADFLSRLKD